MSSNGGRFRRGRVELMAPIDASTVHEIGEGRQSDTTSFLLDGMRFEPRRSEAGIIARVEEEAERRASDLFSEAEAAVERLYAEARVPVIDAATHLPLTRDGHIVWERGEDGSFTEDWSRLDGMDIERAIMVLQHVIGQAGRMVSGLQGRVEFAYAIQQDEYWESYRKVVDGTINDRTARAHRDTRDSRYYYIYTRWIWKTLSDRLAYLEGFKRDLEFMRSRLIREADPFPSQPRPQVPKRTLRDHSGG